MSIVTNKTAAALLGAAASLTAAAKAQDIINFPADVSNSRWQVFSVPDDFDPIRTEYDAGSDSLTLLPGINDPGNTYSWLEGARMVVDPAPNDQPGHLACVTIRYQFNTQWDRNFNLPEIRLRINQADFEKYSNSGVSPKEFELNESGTGEITAYFDRQYLSETERLRVYVDFIGMMPEGQQVAPNFSFTILDTTYFLLSAGGSGEDDQTNKVTAAYMDEDDDLQAQAGGSTSRVQLRSSVDSFAYDGSYVLSLDQGALHVYSAFDNFLAIEVEDDDVISAALSGEHVIYLKSDDGDRELYYYNAEDRTKTRISDNDNYYQVFAGTAGMLLAVELDGERANIFQYNALATNPSLVEIRDDQDRLLIRARDTGRIITLKNGTLELSTDGFIWTLE